MDAEKLKQVALTGVTPFAVTTFRNREKVFGIKTDDRRRHVYVIGKTGMGKTTLIENMVYADILAGHGVCYVDPHGDTAEKMLEWIPTSRINDVVYFNPADLDFPISFNVLEKVSPEYRHLVSSGLIGVFKKLWADSWGPRLEYILRNAILALLEYPDSTLLGINRLLVDKEYRKKVVVKITDPVVRSFWVDEFPRWNERVLQEVISPIQNKVGQFLSTSLIRNVVGQVKSSLDLRKIMDDQKILIMNLSKGRIGEDASHLIGAMMITKIQLAAMSRVNIPEAERKDFYLYVDEFQNFTTESFADILSEARKYRLNLIIAHQYIEQLGEVVQPAVFGNVGTLICFRVGAGDAEFLEKEFLPNLTQEDLVNLPKFNVYLKLMIDGVSSEPFSAKGMPPVYSGSEGNEEKVIAVSRERYAKSKEIVEDKIMRWSKSEQQVAHEEKFHKDATKKAEYEAKKAAMPEGQKPWQKDSGDQKPAYNQSTTNNNQTPIERKVGQIVKTEKEKRFENAGYDAVCYSCKKEIQVPFKPDNVRPVFCKDCLKNARRGKVEVKPDEAIVKEDKRPGVSLSQIPGQTVDFKNRKEPVKNQLKIETRKNEPVKKKIMLDKKNIEEFGTKKETKLVNDKSVVKKTEPAKQENKFKPLIKPQEIKAQPMIKKPEPVKSQSEIKKEPQKQEIRNQAVKANAPVIQQPKIRQQPEIKRPEPVKSQPEINKLPELKTQLEEAKKDELPGANLLGDNSKSINQGDVIKL